MTTAGRELAQWLIATSATLSGLFFVAYQAGRKTKRHLDDWAFTLLFAPFVVGVVALIWFGAGLIAGALISAAQAAAWWRYRLSGSWNVFGGKVSLARFAIILFLLLAFVAGGGLLTYLAIALFADQFWFPKRGETDFLLFLLAGQVIGSIWAFIMVTYEEIS